MGDVTQVDVFDNFVSFWQKFEKNNAEDAAHWMSSQKPDAPEGLWHRKKCEQKDTPQEHIDSATPKDDAVELIKDHLGLVCKIERLEQAEHLITCWHHCRRLSRIRFTYELATRYN